MNRTRTLPLVRLGFITLIAIAALTSVVNFIWLTDVVRCSGRTPSLARDLAEGYRRLEADRAAGLLKPAALSDRQVALALKSHELARQVTSTAVQSIRAMVSALVSAFGLIGAGAAVMVLVSRRISAPLALLLEASERIAEGDLDCHVAYQASDEMGVLVASFNRMTRRLRRAIGCIAEERQALEARVRHATATCRTLSLTDETTGLPNSRHLRSRFRECVGRATQTQTPFTLALVELRNLSSLNDMLGHEAGNLCLVVLGRALRSAAREADFTARYTGDGFVVLMPGLAAMPPEFPSRVDANLAFVSKLIRHRTSKELSLDTRIGEAQYPADGYTLSSLVGAASRALRGASGPCCAEPLAVAEEPVPWKDES